MNRSPQPSHRRNGSTQPNELAGTPRGKRAGYLFVTGASGLVGRYLTCDLLNNGRQLAVLARSNRRLSAHDRIELLVRRWEHKLGHPLPRPIVLEGDVSQPNLGLSRADQDWVSQYCTGLVHNAAVVKFEPAEQDQEPWRTNLLGTRNTLDLARRFELRNIHYVSTAYVCGNRTGLVKETELDCGQNFRNSYEESKFLAEQAVAEFQEFDQKTVYRPAIIAGDSATGYTSSYHGLMWYLRLLALLVPMQPRDPAGRIHTDIELPLSGDEPHNVVTVDWVSKAISRLIDTPEAAGNTFHLVSDFPTTFREVIGWCCDYFNSTGVRFVDRQAGRRATSEFAEVFFSSSRVYQDYDACSVEFDSRNLKRWLPEFSCPQIKREQVIRYLEYGAQDGWGKRRESPPVCFRDAREVATLVAQMAARLLPAEPLALSEPLVLSLNLLGPSGGQWHFQLTPGGSASDIQAGLVSNGLRVLTMPTEEILNTLDQPETQIAGRNFSLADFIRSELRIALEGLPRKPNGTARKLNASNRTTTAGKDDIPAFLPFASRLGIESPAT